MSNVNIIFSETYGYTIRVTITEYNSTSGAWEAIDISGFTTKIIKIEKPDGTTQNISANFYTDGTDGILTANILETDSVLTLVGTYKFQALLSNGSQLFKSSIGRFDVEDAL